MGFWAQLIYPLDVLRHLERFDRCLLGCASEPLARDVTHDPLLCARLQLPTRFWGAGLRCRSALRSPAFVGAADWSLGRFRRDGGDGFLESAGWLGVGKSGAAFAGLMQREAGVRTGDEPANAESFLHNCPSCLLDCREQGQHALTRQVEEARHGALEKSMLALGLLDRRREAYFNCASAGVRRISTARSLAPCGCTRGLLVVGASRHVNLPTLLTFFSVCLCVTARPLSALVLAAPGAVHWMRMAASWMVLRGLGGQCVRPTTCSCGK